MKGKAKYPRITKRYLENWINQKMIDLEIEFRVKSICHTRLRGYEYEGGAAHFVVTMRRVDNIALRIPLYFYIFYGYRDIADHLNDDRYELYFKPQRIGSGIYLPNSEIDLRRK